MQREFWAEFNLYGKLKENEWQNKDILDGLVGKTSEGLPEGWNILNEFSRLQILAATLASDKKVIWKDEKGKERQSNVKDYARTGALQYKEKSGLLYWYYEGDYQNFLLDSLRKMSDILGLNNLHATIASPLPDLATLPPGSWALQLTFTLRKPYISKDDTDFYILDNPVKKEHVFKVPYVAPSQWKGALRAAMVRDLVNTLHSESEDEKQIVDETQFVNERLRLYRLFGNEKDGVADFLNRAWALHRVGPRPEDEDQAQEWEQRFQETVRQVASEFENRLSEEGYRVGDIEGFRGRLHFYPTFFDKIGLEVINPHDRETGAGKNPIYFEAVPKDTKGIFTLLYVPLGEGSTDERTCTQDLAAVAHGVQAMLTEYGFGAKTSSGFGVADVAQDEVEVKPKAWHNHFIHAWDDRGQAQSVGG